MPTGTASPARASRPISFASPLSEVKRRLNRSRNRRRQIAANSVLRQKPPDAAQRRIGRLHRIEAATAVNMLIKVRRSQSGIAEIDHFAVARKSRAILREDRGNHPIFDDHDGLVDRLIRAE